MTTVTFTMCALPEVDGRHPIHMYVKALEPTYTESPGEEHHAMKDAVKVVRAVVSESVGEDPETAKLLKDGEPPADAKPLIQFAIGIIWNRALRLPHYTKVCHTRLDFSALWNPVATVAMDLYEYIFSVLRNRERDERRRKAAKKEAAE